MILITLSSVLLHSSEGLAAFRAVPKGFVTPCDGMFGTEKDAKNADMALHYWINEATVYKEGYDERGYLLEKSEKQSKEQLKETERIINESNKKYKVERAVSNSVWGIVGFLAGLLVH